MVNHRCKLQSLYKFIALEYGKGLTESYFCVVVLLAFTLPKAYEVNKHEVDNAVNSVQKQTTSYYKQYAEPYVQKIPRASTSTANTGSVTAGNHANTGDGADSYSSIPKPNFDSGSAGGNYAQSGGPDIRNTFPQSEAAAPKKYT